jgi:hypothetical protein
MKGRIVSSIVLVVLVWSGSLAALAQARSPEADRPHPGRDDRIGLRGPAHCEGGSLERWSLARRVRPDPSVNVNTGAEFGSAGSNPVAQIHNGWSRDRVQNLLIRRPGEHVATFWIGTSSEFKGWQPFQGLPALPMGSLMQLTIDGNSALRLLAPTRLITAVQATRLARGLARALVCNPVCSE